MDRRTLKGAAAAVLVMAALVGAWMGVQAIRSGDQPGKQAAAYLDALIRLGKLPTGPQVEQALAQAQAQAQAAAPVDGVKPDSQAEDKAK